MVIKPIASYFTSDLLADCYNQIVFGYITCLSAYGVQITVFDENVPNTENIDEIIKNPSYLIEYLFKIKVNVYIE